jgi:hypothetical protein
MFAIGAHSIRGKPANSWRTLDEEEISLHPWPFSANQVVIPGCRRFGRSSAKGLIEVVSKFYREAVSRAAAVSSTRAVGVFSADDEPGPGRSPGRQTPIASRGSTGPCNLHSRGHRCRPRALPCWTRMQAKIHAQGSPRSLSNLGRQTILAPKPPQFEQRERRPLPNALGGEQRGDPIFGSVANFAPGGLPV